MLCCHICTKTALNCSKQHFGRPPHPLCRVLQDTGQSSEKMEIQLQCTWLYSLTAEMRLEALKAHGSEALPSKRSTRQLLLCYGRKPQSKCSVLLVEAELHHNVPHICEERCLHSQPSAQEKGEQGNASALSTPQAPAWRSEREKKRDE